jgi:hypothetical protein
MSSPSSLFDCFSGVIRQCACQGPKSGKEKEGGGMVMQTVNIVYVPDTGDKSLKSGLDAGAKGIEEC